MRQACQESYALTLLDELLSLEVQLENMNCHADSNTCEIHNHYVDNYFSTLNVVSVCDIGRVRF